MDTDKRSFPLFVFPDPVTEPDILSGAAFLYFKQKLILTSPPTVVTGDSFKLLSLVKERQPAWGAQLFGLLDAWQHQSYGFQKMLDIIAPLRKSFITLYMVYPANSEALENSDKLAVSAGFSLDSMFSMINPLNASGEIIRHIMLEAFLELNHDTEALFEYCDNLFTRESIPHLLVKGYLLRLQGLEQMQNVSILLTNERLQQFLNKLPVETDAIVTEEIAIEIIAWELFRQILSPRLDPLDAECAQLIARLLESRGEEIERLRQKCFNLANEVKKPETIQELPKQIERFIRSYVEKEITELLQLDKKELEEFFTSLFTYEKTWAAVLTFIYGAVSGSEVLSTGGAIGALSSFGASAFKAAANRRHKLKQNNFALVYYIRKNI